MDDLWLLHGAFDVFCKRWKLGTRWKRERFVCSSDDNDDYYYYYHHHHHHHNNYHHHDDDSSTCTSEAASASTPVSRTDIAWSR